MNYTKLTKPKMINGEVARAAVTLTAKDIRSLIALGSLSEPVLRDNSNMTQLERDKLISIINRIADTHKGYKAAVQKRRGK